MYSEATRHICCPGCGAREGYRLGDGRKKCRRCGKKYSPRVLRSRLPAKTLKQIALCFWLAAPVATVARELRLNPKTVRRHYDLIRRGIIEGAFRGPFPVMQDERGKGQVREVNGRLDFVLLVGPGNASVSALSAEPTEVPSSFPVSPDVVSYRWHFSARRRLPAPMVEALCHVLLAVDGPQPGELHWLREIERVARIANRSCRLRRWRSRAGHRWLTEEIVFRFNHRDDPGVTAILYGLLSARPSCSDTEAGGL